MPENDELAMMAELDGTGLRRVCAVGRRSQGTCCALFGYRPWLHGTCSIIVDSVALRSHHLASTHHVHHYFSWATLFVITT